MSDIDLDAVLAKRQEVTGSEGDTFGFTFAGRRWTMVDPLLAEDDWKEELADLELDVDVARHYMGDDQYDEFIASGGKSGGALLALREYMQKVTDEMEAGPTRRSTSSNRTQRRSRQR